MGQEILKNLWKNVQIALAAVAVIWAVYLLELILPWDLLWLGIRPRRLDGLWGIVFCPLLHASLNHLAANTGALFVLLALSLTFDRALTFKALPMVWLGGGLLVWLFGGAATHVGMSGVTFGLIGLLLGVGLRQKSLKALGVALLVLIIYGGSMYGLVAFTPGVSWSSHAFGFLSGLGAAWLFAPGGDGQRAALS